MGSYRDLKAWQHAKTLAVLCIRVSKKFPACEQEKGGLADQLRRAATSAALNIAEGCNRSSNRERRKFFEIARTSLDEVSAIVEIASDVEYVAMDWRSTLDERQAEAARTLYGLLRTVNDRLQAGDLGRSRVGEPSRRN